MVNGRPGRDRTLARAVAQAYGSILEPGRYPVGVVYLDLEPELVDVNVHPQKAEVRFADGRAVSDALFRVLADELATAFGMPVATRSWGPATLRSAPPFGSPSLSSASSPHFPSTSLPSPPFPSPPLRPPSVNPHGDPPTLFPNSREGAWLPASSATDRSASEQAPSLPYPIVDPSAAPGRAAFGELKFIAQLRQTFLVCEGPDGLYVLDQHAAAERVTFHRLRRAFVGRDIATQTLLFPVTVEVKAADAALLEEEQDAFTRLGLDVRAVGPTTVAVHAVPRLLARAEPETLVRDLIAEVARTGGRAFSNTVDLVLATMACHGSIRAGDRVSPEEAAFLLTALDEVDFAGHCPHGRPILTRVGWEELERKVGRR
jgi:DNA mismatch repair protein MutL